MRVVACLLVVLAAGCAAPPGTSPKFVSGPNGEMRLPVEIEGNNIYQRGGGLPIATFTGGTAGTVTFTNVKTGVSRSSKVAFQGTAPTLVSLDAAVLPDLVSDATVQRFRARVDVDQVGGTEKEIYVVSDADVQPFPKVVTQFGGGPEAGDGARPHLPPGKAPMTLDPSQAGVDTYVRRMTEDWNLEKPAAKTSSIQRGSVTIPEFLRQMPESIPLVVARVDAKFGKYLVPEIYSPTNQDDVFVPATMTFVLTQTDPAILVKLTAIPPAAGK